MPQYIIRSTIYTAMMLNGWHREQRSQVAHPDWSPFFIYCLVYIVIHCYFFSLLLDDVIIPACVCAAAAVPLWALCGRGCHVIIYVYPNVRGPSTDIVHKISICGDYYFFHEFFENILDVSNIHPRDTI